MNDQIALVSAASTLLPFFSHAILEIHIPRNPKPNGFVRNGKFYCATEPCQADSNFLKINQIPTDTSTQVIVYNDGPVRIGFKEFRIQGPTIRAEFGSNFLIPDFDDVVVTNSTMNVSAGDDIDLNAAAADGDVSGDDNNINADNGSGDGSGATEASLAPLEGVEISGKLKLWAFGGSVTIHHATVGAGGHLDLTSFRNSVHVRLDTDFSLKTTTRSVNSMVCLVGASDSVVTKYPSINTSVCTNDPAMKALGGGERRLSQNWVIEYYDQNGDGFMKMDEFRDVLHSKLGRCCSARCPLEAHSNFFRQFDCDNLVQSVFPNSASPDNFGRFGRLGSGEFYEALMAAQDPMLFPFCSPTGHIRGTGINPQTVPVHLGSDQGSVRLLAGKSVATTTRKTSGWSVLGVRHDFPLEDTIESTINIAGLKPACM
jgi:hypothetical protein